MEFLSWFLNALHLALNGTKKSTSSIIYKSFLGAMKIHSQRIPPIDATDKEKDALMLTAEYVETFVDSPFLFLAADLPPPPLFKDEFRENIIPQVCQNQINLSINLKLKSFVDFFRFLCLLCFLSSMEFSKRNTRHTKKTF